jgi:hypothetical protein
VSAQDRGLGRPFARAVRSSLAQYLNNFVRRNGSTKRYQRSPRPQAESGGCPVRNLHDSQGVHAPGKPTRPDSEARIIINLAKNREGHLQSCQYSYIWSIILPRRTATTPIGIPTTGQLLRLQWSEQRVAQADENELSDRLMASGRPKSVLPSTAASGRTAPRGSSTSCPPELRLRGNLGRVRYRSPGAACIAANGWAMMPKRRALQEPPHDNGAYVAYSEGHWPRLMTLATLSTIVAAGLRVSRGCR